MRAVNGRRAAIAGGYGLHLLLTCHRVVLSAPGHTWRRCSRENRSPYECYEGIRVQRRAVAGGPLVGADAHVRLFDVEFSPNRVTFGVASDGRGRS